MMFEFSLDEREDQRDIPILNRAAKHREVFRINIHPNPHFNGPPPQRLNLCAC